MGTAFISRRGGSGGGTNLDGTPNVIKGVLNSNSASYRTTTVTGEGWLGCVQNMSLSNNYINYKYIIDGTTFPESGTFRLSCQGPLLIAQKFNNSFTAYSDSLNLLAIYSFGKDFLKSKPGCVFRNNSTVTDYEVALVETVTGSGWIGYADCAALKIDGEFVTGTETNARRVIGLNSIMRFNESFSIYAISGSLDATAIYSLEG